MRPAKTHISLGGCRVWSESSLSAWRSLESVAIHWAHSEDCDQTGRMPSLIWVFGWRTGLFVGFVMWRLIFLIFWMYTASSFKSVLVLIWFSGRVSDSGARGRGFETYHRRVVSLSKTLYSPKVLVNYPGSDGSVPTWLKICWLGR